MKEAILKKAKVIAGTTMFVKEAEIDKVLAGGWDAIPNGEIVYRDGVYKGLKTYTKIDNDTVENQDGVAMIMDEKQKKNMLGMYALIRGLKQN